MPNQHFGRIYKDFYDLGWTCQDFEDLEGFWIKISLKVSKTVKIHTFLLEIVVFPGKKPPEAAFLVQKADFWAG